MKTIMSLAVLGALACSLGSCSAQRVDNRTIGNLDLNSYLGDWYEIARFDHSFERGMSNSMAKYTIRPDGKVSVVNSGWRDGKYKESTGKAYSPDPAGNPGLLRVSFFGPFYSDYRVMMLMDNYRYALVGSGSAKYLWILSRSPEIPQTVRERFLSEASRRGYDVSKLIWVDQSVNIRSLYGND